MNRPTEKPVIQLRMDQRVSEVQAQSTFKFSSGFLDGNPGLEFVTVPHLLIYQDDFLKVRIEDAGGLSTLATRISTTTILDVGDPEATINSLVVHLLPDYAPLPVAIKRARALRDELVAQGFVFNQRPWKSRFRAIIKSAPKSLDAFEDLEPAFLSSAFFVEEATVFDMSKGKIRLEVSLVNGRRRWGSRIDSTDTALDSPEVRAAKEVQAMSRDDLLSEPSYTLRLAIGPTNEWRSKRSEEYDIARKRKLNQN